MRYVKIFRNVHSGSLRPFAYNADRKYYSYVKNIINTGYQQCIISSDLMINLADEFILKHGGALICVEFLQEDEELSGEINALIDKQCFNKAYWSLLKDRLIFLNDEESIDLKKIEISGREGDNPYHLHIFMNGIIGLDGDDSITNIVLNIMEAHIR